MGTAPDLGLAVYAVDGPLCGNISHHHRHCPVPAALGPVAAQRRGLLPLSDTEKLSGPGTRPPGLRYLFLCAAQDHVPAGIFQYTDMVSAAGGALPAALLRPFGLTARKLCSASPGVCRLFSGAGGSVLSLHSAGLRRLCGLHDPLPPPLPPLPAPGTGLPGRSLSAGRRGLSGDAPVLYSFGPIGYAGFHSGQRRLPLRPLGRTPAGTRPVAGTASAVLPGVFSGSFPVAAALPSQGQKALFPSAVVRAADSRKPGRTGLHLAVWQPVSQLSHGGILFPANVSIMGGSETKACLLSGAGLLRAGAFDRLCGHSVVQQPPAAGVPALPGPQRHRHPVPAPAERIIGRKKHRQAPAHASGHTGAMGMCAYVWPVLHAAHHRRPARNDSGRHQPPAPGTRPGAGCRHPLCPPL